MEIRYFDTLDSTNKYCKLLNPNEVEEFLVVLAATQTDGIGQAGNHWESESGKNLTFSIILKPTFLLAEEQYNLTMAVAVAVHNTVTQLLHEEQVSIKWPNDIYVGDRKICGILTSCQVKCNHISQAICGIGLNVNQTLFPEWVPNPVSLRQTAGREFNLEKVLKTMLEEINSCYEALKTDSKCIREKYLSLLYRKGVEAWYLYRGEPTRGTIEGVDPFGRLLLRRSDDSTLLLCGMKEIQFSTPGQRPEDR